MGEVLADDAHAHGDHHSHAPHESPVVMLAPLAVLAVGAVFAGVVFHDVFFGHADHVEHFFAGSLVVGAEILDAAHHVPTWVKWAPTLAMILGFAIAWQMYIRSPQTPARLAAANPGLHRFLYNKWYFDELYDRIFVRPALALGTFFWRQVDDRLIDGAIVEGLGRRVKDVTGRVVRLQSGYLYHYAFVMLIGVALLLTWAIATGSAAG